MCAGYREVKGREEAVDISDLPTGDDGKSIVEIAREALDLPGEIIGNVYGLRALGDFHQRAVEVGEQGERGQFRASFRERLGHGSPLVTVRVMRETPGEPKGSRHMPAMQVAGL
jgi:hypothetical protein